MRGLGKFKAEDFEATENSFHKLPSLKTGMTKAEIRYAIHDRVVPEVLTDVTMEQIYQI